MARNKEKAGLASFQEVANTNVNINNDTNINDNVNKEEDFLGKVLDNKKKKDVKDNLRGIYFDDDVVAILDNLGKKGGRGAKSKIVNEAVRKSFIEKGLL